MATFTASGYSEQPRLSHEGLTSVRTTFTQGGSTLSASDIILMARIPNHVWLVDGYASGTSGAADTVLKIGHTGSETSLHTGASFSATAQMNRFNGLTLPTKISLSDSALPQTVDIFMTHNAGTTTVTGSFQIVVQYCASGAM